MNRALVAIGAAAAVYLIFMRKTEQQYFDAGVAPVATTRDQKLAKMGYRPGIK